MYFLNVNVIRVLQRVIELLAFYFILANIDGKTLKEATGQLINPKYARFPLSNVLVLIAYPIAMSLVIEWDFRIGLLADHVLRPFVALFLLRKLFGFGKVLLTFAFSAGISTLTLTLRLLFNAETSFIFIVNLLIIISIVYLNAFHYIYQQLLKKTILKQIILFIAFVLYVLPFLLEVANDIFMVFIALISLYILWFAQLRMKEELDFLAEVIQENSIAEVLATLKKLSVNNEVTAAGHYFKIRHPAYIELYAMIEKELATHRLFGNIKDFECKITRGKINIIIIN